MKRFLLSLALVVTLLSGSLGIKSVYADCSKPATAKEQIQCGACDASGSASCDPSTAPGDLQGIIRKVIDIISVLAGAAAVVMIIIGGFRYVTSGGNAESTKAARNTIVYAVIGLVVIAMAQLIVHFTLNTVANNCVNNKTPSGQAC